MIAVTILLWLLIAGYGLYLLAEFFYLPQAYGETLVKPAMRRRWVDNMMLFAAIVFGLYHAFTDSRYVVFLTPLAILTVLVLITFIRPPRWHLKGDGFVYMFRFVPYSAIQAMQLSETGVLLILLNGGGKVQIPFANMIELEKAAAFFANEERLQRMFTPQAETTND